MRLPRRRFLQLAAGVAALPAVSRLARAQTYPARPITIIVPFAPGGGTDVPARIVGEHMSRTLGQQIVVQNVVGAGGTVGSTRAMRADPDGYTILMGQMGTHAAAVALYPESRLQAGCRFRADRPGLELRVGDRGQEGLSAEGPQGIRLLREGQRRQAQHVACRRRLDLLHHLPDAQLDPGRETRLGAVQRRRPGHERVDGRSSRLYVRHVLTAAPQLQAGTIKAYAIAARRAQSGAAERAHDPGGRASRVPGIRLECACSRPSRHRSRSSTSSPTRSTRRSTTTTRASACARSAQDIPDKSRRGQQALRALVKSEIARWTPIIKAANVKLD